MKDKKKGVARLSVSLDDALLRQWDKLRKRQGYKNRSLAVADLMRDRLVEHRSGADENYEAAGSVTLVYDHHHSQVQGTLTDLQHDFTAIIVTCLHVHLDHQNCLEVIVLRGPVSAIKRLADRLIGCKGVKHGKLSLTSTGREFAG